MVWFAAMGLIMAAGTLGVISWGKQAHSATVAHTMGITTFSLANVFFSIAAKDDRRTIFSLDTFADRTFVLATAVSALAILLATVFGPLQALLDTTKLDVRQWIICVFAALPVVVATEIRKTIAHRKEGIGQ
jgi:Ca2+-transporting ATPase